MTDTIKDFYPRLADLPKIVELVKTNFDDRAPQVLQGMKACTIPNGIDGDELEELILQEISANAIEVASFKASGKNASEPELSMAYFAEHHPEALALLEKMGGAPGFEPSDFVIQVLQYQSLFAVVADDFESECFDTLEQALGFVEINYDSFIKKASN